MSSFLVYLWFLLPYNTGDFSFDLISLLRSLTMKQVISRSFSIDKALVSLNYVEYCAKSIVDMLGGDFWTSRFCRSDWKLYPV